MPSYNNSKEFNNQFFDNYDDLFSKVASSLSVAVSDPSVTDEERKEIIKTNVKTIVNMSNVYHKEETLFNRARNQ